MTNGSGYEFMLCRISISKIKSGIYDPIHPEVHAAK